MNSFLWVLTYEMAVSGPLETFWVHKISLYKNTIDAYNAYVDLTSQPTYNRNVKCNKQVVYENYPHK